jgi:hypothetical protein
MVTQENRGDLKPFQKKLCLLQDCVQEAKWKRPSVIASYKESEAGE